MNQEQRKKIKMWQNKDKDNGLHYSWHSFSDIINKEELRQSIKFDSPEDVDYELMDFFFNGMLSRILRHAGICAHDYHNWCRAYEEFKPYISHYVGWGSFISKEKHPMLHSQEAYDLILELLSNVCYEGADKRRKKKNKRK